MALYNRYKTMLWVVVLALLVGVWLVQQVGQSAATLQNMTPEILGENTALLAEVTVDQVRPLIDGSHEIDYTYTITNTASTTVTKLVALNDLVEAFRGAIFTIKDISAVGLTLNPDFDGTDVTSLLTAGNSIPAGTRRTISLSIELNPNGQGGQFLNTVSVTGDLARPPRSSSSRSSVRSSSSSRASTAASSRRSASSSSTATGGFTKSSVSSVSSANRTLSIQPVQSATQSSSNSSEDPQVSASGSATFTLIAVSTSSTSTSNSVASQASSSKPKAQTKPKTAQSTGGRVLGMSTTDGLAATGVIPTEAMLAGVLILIALISISINYRHANKS